MMQWKKLDKRSKYLMGMAKGASEKATCHSRKIGSVIWFPKTDETVVGWNGPPVVEDCSEIAGTEKGKCPRKGATGENLNICPAVHAEIRAILRAKKSVEGCYMYLWCGMPCKDCMKECAEAGIKRIYCLARDFSDHEKRMASEHYNFELSEKIADACGVDVIRIKGVPE